MLERNGAQTVVMARPPMEAGVVAQRNRDGVPVDVLGNPDVIAMRSAGLEWHADLYELRCQAVFAVLARRKGALYGKRTAIVMRTAREYNRSREWLQRLLRDSDEGENLLALVPRKGLAAKGKYLSIPAELQRQVLDAWAYGDRYTARQIHENVVLPFFEVNSGKPPDVRTVQRFLAHPLVCPPVVSILAREGKRAFQEACELRVHR